MFFYLAIMFLVILCAAAILSYFIYTLIDRNTSANNFVNSNNNDINLLKTKIKHSKRKAI
jgi:hypothetical protein